MSTIKVTNLTFAYPFTYTNIFENCSFSIDTDWKLGFVGRNGRGKTTFLKLLQNQYTYSGNIISSVQFDYFPYEVADRKVNTIDVVCQLAPDCMEWRIVRELNLLEVSEDVLYRPFETLSCGEQTKVLLAAFFLNDRNFHLIDEPTNHLDSHGRHVVAEYLSRKKSFILVSHDRDFLDKCVDHILSLNKKTIEVQCGNYSTWKQNFDNRQSNEQKNNDRLNKEINALKESARRMMEWSVKIEATKIGSGAFDKGYIGTQAALMMKHAKSVEKRRQRAIEEKSALLKDLEFAPQLKLHSMPYVQSKLVELKDVTVFYDDRQVFEPLSFTISQGDRVVLNGANGCGKSSVVKLIMGEELKYSGELWRGNNLEISYICQDASHLKGTVYQYAQDNKVDLTLFLTILRKLDFSREQFDKPIESFSMGQKKKVLVAGSLAKPAHLYIWDEPLNYIDLYSRLQIEQLVQSANATMLVVEHDTAFQHQIATRIVNIAKRML